jgi:hypothetical protein
VGDPKFETPPTDAHQVVCGNEFSGSANTGRGDILRDAQMRLVRDFFERNGLADGQAALRDTETALAYLERPKVIARLRGLDPLNPAWIRGLRRMRELLGAEGGICDAQGLAAILGVEPREVKRRRENGELIGLRLAQDDWVYPVWQFGHDAALIPGLASIMAEEPELDGWTWQVYILAPNIWLDGERPLDLLRREDVEPVRKAVRLYGDQVAV